MSAVNPAVKLDWYNEGAPEEAAKAKALFIEKVNKITTTSNDYSTIILIQLRGYHIKVSQLAAPDDASRSHQWADDILGLGNRRIHTHSQTLEAEVECYLSDNQVGTSIISYWQVCPLAI